MGQGSSSEKNTQQLNAESRSHEKNINKNKNELKELRKSIDNLHMEIQNNKRDREQDDKIAQIKQKAEEDRMKREAEESIQNDSLKRLQTESSSLRNNITGVNTQLSQLGQRVNGYNTAVTGLESRLAENSKKLLSVESSLNDTATQLSGSLNSIKGGLISNSRRLGTVESGLAANSTRLGNVQSGLAANSTRLGNVQSGLAANSTRLDKVQSGLTNIFKKLGNVESVSAVNSRRLGNVESVSAVNSRRLGNVESGLAANSRRLNGGYTSTSNSISNYLNYYKDLKVEVELLEVKLNKEKERYRRWEIISSMDYIKKLKVESDELSRKLQYILNGLVVETIKLAYPKKYNFVDDLKQHFLNRTNIDDEDKENIKSIKDTDMEEMGELLLDSFLKEEGAYNDEVAKFNSKIDSILEKENLTAEDLTNLRNNTDQFITIFINIAWDVILKVLINKNYDNNVPKEVKDKFENPKLELIKNLKDSFYLLKKIELLEKDIDILSQPKEEIPKEEMPDVEMSENERISRCYSGEKEFCDVIRIRDKNVVKQTVDALNQVDPNDGGVEGVINKGIDIMNKMDLNDGV